MQRDPIPVATVNLQEDLLVTLPFEHVGCGDRTDTAVLLEHDGIEVIQARKPCYETIRIRLQWGLNL
jgi:hypothetical protein